MNYRGILACRGGFQTRPYRMRRPPGWPLLEALVIVAVILLAILVVESLAALIGTP